ncbi:MULTISPECIES: GntR family transcriptional regulator [Chelatococcus]|uniref:DNA-binding GntR family transcriptional regulator n=1 Tax=Chelatococcus caeni TaxID=1348468 RepID=A0A840C1Z6_9HYPH|nr:MULTISPECIES: GntR family transcriptional regulator [Chelatococcus]ALA17674.1 transcriptional regulator [Chelatococcus sp. CO-6]MBB4019574.1 DNA-binding GntR family transcriptional regulator [Chelatococcus caeni]
MNVVAPSPDELVDKTNAEKAYRLIREDIVSGELRPGLKLKIEMLRDRYGIGAGPLREALARLSGDHLVTLFGQRGFVVAEMSVEDAREIGNLRKMLEAEALSESIPAGDRAWEERVITTYHRLERLELSANQGVDHLAEWERLNHAFHEALVSACPSAWLLRLRAMMFKHHERYRRLSRVRTVLTRDIHLEHRALLDSALERDTARAVDTIRTHVQRTTDAVIAALADAGRR